jgi:hypothetical protein
MKRKEEIAKYCEDMGFPLGSCSSINSIKALTASDAIKWADETMINKACEYLYEWNRKQVLKHGSKANISCSEFTISVYDFRKAMKGELS